MIWIMLYLFAVVDQIRELTDLNPGFYAIGVISILVLVIVSVICSLQAYTYDVKDYSVFDSRWFRSTSKIIKWYWFALMITCIIHALIPTQKNLAIMIGSGAAYEAVTSEAGKRIGGKVIDLLEHKINEAIGDDPIFNKEKVEKGDVKEAEKASESSGAYAT